jgi:AcrR family transcriptional regulator
MSSAKSKRTPLSTERILRAALVIADRDGVDALSMRKLAASMGYEVMSLYNHVASKEEVLDGLVEIVVDEIVPPPPGPWKPALRATVISAHQALLRHRWAVAAWATTSTGPKRLAFQEALLRTMRDGTLPAPIAYHGYHAVLMHILGFTLQEVSFDLDDESLREMAAASLQRLDADAFPHMTEHIRQHLDVEHSSLGDDYEFVLDLILDGLERAARQLKHQEITSG